MGISDQEWKSGKLLKYIATRKFQKLSIYAANSDAIFWRSFKHGKT